MLSHVPTGIATKPKSTIQNMSPTVSTATSNWGFKSLPFELREMIWQQSLPSRALLLDSELMFLHRSPLRRPIISEVCREARRIVVIHGTYLKFSTSANNKVKRWSTWFDPSIDSLFLRPSNMLCGDKIVDYGFFDRISCKSYGRDTVEYRVDLKALLTNYAQKSFSVPIGLCIQVPAWPLKKMSDYEGLATISPGLWKQVKFTDLFGWIPIPITWKLPPKMQVDLFPEGATTCLIDVYDMKRLENICQVYNATGTQEDGIVRRKFDNLNRLLNPKMHKLLVSHKLGLLRTNWLSIQWWLLSTKARRNFADALVNQPSSDLQDPFNMLLGREEEMWSRESQFIFNQDSAWVQETLQAMPDCRYVIVLERIESTFGATCLVPDSLMVYEDP